METKILEFENTHTLQEKIAFWRSEGWEEAKNGFLVRGNSVIQKMVKEEEGNVLPEEFAQAFRDIHKSGKIAKHTQTIQLPGHPGKSTLISFDEGGEIKPDREGRCDSCGALNKNYEWFIHEDFPNYKYCTSACGAEAFSNTSPEVLEGMRKDKHYITVSEYRIMQDVRDRQEKENEELQEELSVIKCQARTLCEIQDKLRLEIKGFKQKEITNCSHCNEPLRDRKTWQSKHKDTMFCSQPCLSVYYKKQRGEMSLSDEKLIENIVNNNNDRRK